VSSYAAIQSASSALRDLLDAHITASADSQIAGVPVGLVPPTKTAAGDGTQPELSLWLYRITRDPDLQNRPRRRAGQDTLSRSEVPLDLHFLVTPVANHQPSAQLLLGRVVQVLGDHGVLKGSAVVPLDPLTDELHVSLETLTLEELTRIWASLHAPYRLSLAYLVQAVRIESHDDPALSSPVLVRDTTYHQIAGAH
jgi:uncharacterized protein DUF4255